MPPISRGFHPTKKNSSGWFKVPPAVPLSPAVPVSTRVSAEMKHPLGTRDSPVNITYKEGSVTSTSRPRRLVSNALPRLLFCVVVCNKNAQIESHLLRTRCA